MTDRLIIVTEIEDDERYEIVWQSLEDAAPDLTTPHSCEIDTSTWDADAWCEWQQRLEMIEDILVSDEDSIIIWKIDKSGVERYTVGLRA